MSHENFENRPSIPAPGIEAEIARSLEIAPYLEAHGVNFVVDTVEGPAIPLDAQLAQERADAIERRLEEN